VTHAHSRPPTPPPSQDAACGQACRDRATKPGWRQEAHFKQRENEVSKNPTIRVCQRAAMVCVCVCVCVFECVCLCLWIARERRFCVPKFKPPTHPSLPLPSPIHPDNTTSHAFIHSHLQSAHKRTAPPILLVLPSVRVSARCVCVG
jgi:hypothetical protein